MTLFRFLIVGGFGFLVDATVLQVLYAYYGLPITYSRFVSFSIACSVTWYCNRRFTFAVASTSRTKLAEYTRYIGVQAAGAITNLVVFFALIQAHPQLTEFPVVPLAGGASVAVLVTFFGSKLCVFNRY